MKKELISKYDKIINNRTQDFLELKKEAKHYETKIKLIELKNLNTLKDYPEYIYMYYLMLTDINIYKKENNLSPSLTKENIKDYFIRNNKSKIQYFDRILDKRPNRLISSIYKTMQNEYDYLNLEYLISQIKKYKHEKRNLTEKVTFDFELPPFKQIQSMNNGEYNLADLMNLKRVTEIYSTKLTQIKDLFESYSPLMYTNILNDSYPNKIEQTRGLVINFKLPQDDSNYEEYNKLVQHFNNNYTKYKRLRITTKFTKNKEELFSMTNILLEVHERLFEIVKESIINRYKQLLPLFEDYFGKKFDIDYISNNYKWYIKDIDEFIEKLSLIKNIINNHIDEIINKQNKIDQKIVEITNQIKRFLNISSLDLEELLQIDLFEGYKEYNLYQLANEIDKEARDEIFTSYGKISEEAIYRKIPIK